MPSAFRGIADPEQLQLMREALRSYGNAAGIERGTREYEHAASIILALFEAGAATVDEIVQAAILESGGNGLTRYLRAWWVPGSSIIHQTRQKAASILGGGLACPATAGMAEGAGLMEADPPCDLGDLQPALAEVADGEVAPKLIQSCAEAEPF